MSRVAKTVFLLALLTAANAQTPGIATRILMQAPLGDVSEPGMSLSVINLQAAASVPSHSHAGAVFAYVLEGDIENQIEPEPAVALHEGGFFHERPLQVHRVFRNLSQTESAKILILQNTDLQPGGARPLIHEKLENLAGQQVSVVMFSAPPGAAAHRAHRHPGSVFAYIAKGEIENQVDPDPAKIYRAGDAFYEAPLHAHRLFRNISKTKTAEVIVFEVSETGQPLALSAEKQER